MSFQANINKTSNCNKPCNSGKYKNQSHCNTVPPCNNCARTEYQINNPCNLVPPCDNCSRIQYKNNTPCNSVPPCNNCVTIESSICEDTCIPECEPKRSTKACCEKPKKSFWQQLFGDKCRCFKKNCGCKTRKKANPKVTKELVCRPVQEVDCSPCLPPPPQPCVRNKPVVPCKADVQCPRRICLPPPNSIGGCHFYFNIGKDPRHKRISRCETNNGGVCGKRSSSPPPGYSPGNFKRFRSRSPSTREYCDDINDEQGGYKYTAGNKLKKKDSDGIHIGLTVTKEETKYIPNNTTVQNANGQSINTKISDQPSNCSDQVLTLEIHKSGVTLNEDKNQNNTSDEEYNENERESHGRKSTIPYSESYSRELKPMLQRRTHVSINSPKTSVNKVSNGNLDRRVSEILRKLECIETKIKGFERKEGENKLIKIDYDGQKSTVSVHVNDGCINNKRNLDKCGTNTNENHQSDAVIEIRKTRFNSQSPCRTIQPSPQGESHKVVCCDERNNHTKQKIVIKLPSDNNKHHNQPCENEYIECNDKPLSAYSSTWCQIANNLKLNSPQGLCYCVKCCSRNKDNC